MHSRALLFAAPGLFALACTSALMPDGGPCKYEPFDGPCEPYSKRVLRDGADGAPMAIEVEYRGSFRAYARRSYEFAPDQEEAALADIMTRGATCVGQTIIGGNCSPGRLGVLLEGEDPNSVPEDDSWSADRDVD